MSDPAKKISIPHGILIVVSAIGLLLCGLSGLGGINQNLSDWEGSLWVAAAAISFFLMTRVLPPR